MLGQREYFAAYGGVAIGLGMFFPPIIPRGWWPVRKVGSETYPEEGRETVMRWSSPI